MSGKKVMGFLSVCCLTLFLSACGADGGGNAQTEQETDNTESEKLQAGDSSGSGTEEWENAMDSYKEFLAEETYQWTEGENVWLPDVKFMTEDLNSDGIPELLIKNTKKIYNRDIQVFTITMGVDDIASGAGETGGWYYPGTGVFAMRCDEDAESINSDVNTYFYLKDTEDYPVGIVSETLLIIGYESGPASRGQETYDWLGLRAEIDDDDDDGSGEKSQEEYFKEQYPEGERNTTKENFEASLEKMTGGVERVYLPPVSEWHENTEANRNQYLK